MNWIDCLLLLVIGLSVLSGFMTGFARVAVGSIAALLGIFCGLWFYGVAGAYVLDYVSSRAIANLIGFFVIFLGIVLLGAIVGRILAKFLKWVGMSWFDRLLGGAFGLARGALVAVALVTVLMAFAPSPAPRSVGDSKLMPYVATVSSVLATLTPHEIRDGFWATKDGAQKMWQEHRTETSRSQPPGPPRHE